MRKPAHMLLSACVREHVCIATTHVCFRTNVDVFDVMYQFLLRHASCVT